MTKKHIIAIVGGGSDSAVGRAHISALRLTGKFTIKAACFADNPKKNAESAKEYGLDEVKLFRSIGALIQDEIHLDAIVILTPTNLHYEHVCLAIKNKIPVICEKSLTTSSKKAKQINSLLQKYNGYLVTTFNYLGYPMLREIKNLVTLNSIGRIQQINIEMPQQTFLKKNNGKAMPPQKWRQRDYEISTISLDLGVHIHSILFYLIEDNPTDVLATFNNYGHIKNVTDDIKVIAKFPNSVSSLIWYSKVALGSNNGLKFKIMGEKGSIEWLQEEPDKFYQYENNGKKNIIDLGDDILKVANQKRYQRFKAGHPTGFIEAFANLYEDIHNSLSCYQNDGTQTDIKNLLNMSNSINGLSLLEAFEKSNNLRVKIIKL